MPARLYFTAAVAAALMAAPAAADPECFTDRCQLPAGASERSMPGAADPVAARPARVRPQMVVDAEPRRRPARRDVEYRQPEPRHAVRYRAERYRVERRLPPSRVVEHYRPEPRPLAPRRMESPLPPEPVVVVEAPPPARYFVNQGPSYAVTPGPSYVVNQGPTYTGPGMDRPAYDRPGIVVVSSPAYRDNGIVVVYPQHDPAWKRCQIDPRGGQELCGPQSYHPYGAPGYRPYGTYKPQRGPQIIGVAPDPRIVTIQSYY